MRQKAWKVRQVGWRAESPFLIHKTRACTKHKQRWRNNLEQLEFYSFYSALKAHSKPLFACNDLAASSMYIVICYLNVVWCIWTNFCDVLFMNRLASQSQSKATCLATSHHIIMLYTLEWLDGLVFVTIKLLFDNIEILFKWNKNRTSHGWRFHLSLISCSGTSNAHELWFGNVTWLDRSQRFIIQIFGCTWFDVKMNYGMVILYKFSRTRW